MVSRLDVKTPADGGIGLGAWLFLPNKSGRRPGITKVHGFAGTGEHGLARFAQAFAEAGFVVLVHDHRNFGESGGRRGIDILGGHFAPYLGQFARAEIAATNWFCEHLTGRNVGKC